MSTAGPLFQEASPYRVDVTSFDFTSANAPGTRAIITDADGSETITFELSEQTAGNVWRGVGTLDYQDGQGHSIAFTNATQTTSDSNDRMNPAAIRLTPQFYNHTAATANQHWDYYVTIVSPDGDETLASDVYSASTSAPEVLIVDGYDRWLTQNVQNPGRENHDFVAVTADAIAANGRGFASASNEALIRGDAELSNVLLSAWVLGEESSVDETFSNQEQTIVSTAAGTGHHLFVSGSEIAWDLDRDSGPSGTDRAFLNTVLGADLGGNANDDSGVYTFSTVSGSPLVSGTFDDGTGGIYEVGFPDVLTPVGAFTAFAEYTGGDIAGVTDGNSVIYLGFPFETILSQTVREDLMAAVLNSLLPVASVTDWTVLDY
jgi:hypothetical protein